MLSVWHLYIFERLGGLHKHFLNNITCKVDTRSRSQFLMSLLLNSRTNCKLLCTNVFLFFKKKKIIFYKFLSFALFFPDTSQYCSPRSPIAAIIILLLTTIGGISGFLTITGGDIWFFNNHSGRFLILCPKHLLVFVFLCEKRHTKQLI